MIRSKLTAGLIAGVLSAFTFGLVGSAANAVTPLATGYAVSSPASIELAATKKVVVKKGHKKWVYTKKYGKRYKARRPGYVYYYGGWWYPRPWWRPGVTLCIGC